MTLKNYSMDRQLSDHETWRNDLVFAIQSFKTQFHTLPSYILANNYTHSLLDIWINHTSSGGNKLNNLTHFIVDGNYIHLVYDNTIKDEVIKLQYDAFFELENNKQKSVIKRQKKVIAA